MFRNELIKRVWQKSRPDCLRRVHRTFGRVNVRKKCWGVWHTLKACVLVGLEIAIIFYYKGVSLSQSSVGMENWKLFRTTIKTVSSFSPACVAGGLVRRRKVRIRFLAPCWTSSKGKTGAKRKIGGERRRSFSSPPPSLPLQIFFYLQSFFVLGFASLNFPPSHKTASYAGYP